VTATSSKAVRAAERAERLAAKAQALAERTRRQEAKAARIEAERRAQAEAAVHAFGHYLQVREWAGALASDAATTDPLAQQLARVWNASPEDVAQLRRWCDPISGVRAADYESPSEALARRLQREAMALRSHRGTELLVQESPILGGFGIVRNGQRVNEETLRWFAAAIALEDGGVLEQFRGRRQRQLVWAIGGWGGFAYAFKTLCPHVTMLVTGIPETLLISAVYLMTAFPDARCRFFEPADENLWSAWDAVDFVFAPESAVARFQPPPVALTLDVMALRGMEPARIRSLVRRAYDFRSTYLYSQLPAARAPEDARRVWDEINRWYWLHPVPPRGMSGIAYPPPAAEEGSVHVVGWRRIRP
jgi:hypothetical protein